MARYILLGVEVKRRIEYLSIVYQKPNNFEKDHGEEVCNDIFKYECVLDILKNACLFRLSSNLIAFCVGLIVMSILLYIIYVLVH
jgi:hypothetical protein